MSTQHIPTHLVCHVVNKPEYNGLGVRVCEMVGDTHAIVATTPEDIQLLNTSRRAARPPLPPADDIAIKFKIDVTMLKDISDPTAPEKLQATLSLVKGMNGSTAEADVAMRRYLDDTVGRGAQH